MFQSSLAIVAADGDSTSRAQASVKIRFTPWENPADFWLSECLTQGWAKQVGFTTGIALNGLAVRSQMTSVTESLVSGRFVPEMPAGVQRSSVAANANR
jgi:hypothetical protein